MNMSRIPCDHELVAAQVAGLLWGDETAAEEDAE
jgi:hypothetical protein